MGLTLSINGISMALTLFSPGGGYDRYYAESLGAAVEYSMAGVPVVDGPAQEAPLFWQVTTQLYGRDRLLLFNRIVQEQNRLRYTAPYTGYAVRLIDGNRQWVEPTQTRLASGSVTNRTGYVEYTAQFDVLILSPKVSENGKVYEVSFTMAELGRVPPA